MANFPVYEVGVTVRDGAGRDSSIQMYVPLATFQTYAAAADKAARDATAVGGLLSKAVAATAGAEVKRWATIADITDPVTLPAEDILRGNKIVLGFRSSGRAFTMTLPCRSGNVADYTQKPDSIEIDLEAAGDLATFITAFNAAAISITGSSVAVDKAYVND